MTREDQIREVRLFVGGKLRHVGKILTGLGIVVDPRDAQEILREAAREKMSNVLEGADHPMASQEDFDSTTGSDMSDIFPESEEGFDPFDQDDEDDFESETGQP